MRADGSRATATSLAGGSTAAAPTSFAAGGKSASVIACEEEAVASRPSHGLGRATTGTSSTPTPTARDAARTVTACCYGSTTIAREREEG